MLQPADPQGRNSGPVVIHVLTPQTDEETRNLANNSTMTSRNRRPRSSMLLMGCSVIVLAVLMFLYSSEQLEHASANTHSKKTLKTASQRNFKDDKMFDVNAPPIPNRSDRDKGGDDEYPFAFWGQQSNRFEESAGKSAKKNKKGKKKPEPFPIIEDEEDVIPRGAAGAVIRAADALLCRDSVIDYVINATDLKDECDGLKKAFTKNCADEEEPEAGSRRLTSEDRQSFTNQRRNPLILLQYSLYRTTRYLRSWWKPKDAIFMAEEHVLNEWEAAAYEVSQDWDLLFDVQSLPNYVQRRLSLKDESSYDSDELLTAPDAPQDPPANKTTAARERQKFPSLALPTTRQHVSEKMVSETLMLQQEGKLMASVKAAQNNTNVTVTEAAADAAVSAKAVSDATDIVSSVLNDPTSVEARTCCASILNVFHENCYVDEEEELSDRRLFIVVAVIACCGLVKSLIRHFHIRWLPEAAGCILVGGKALNRKVFFFTIFVQFSFHLLHFSFTKSPLGGDSLTFHTMISVLMVIGFFGYWSHLSFLRLLWASINVLSTDTLFRSFSTPCWGH